MAKKDTLRNADVEDLLTVLAEMDDTDQIFAFLEDVFTIREIRESSQRLAVARLLDDKVSYSEIESRLGASATTIARVSKCLIAGTGGYDDALEILRQSKGVD